MNKLAFSSDLMQHLETSKWFCTFFLVSLQTYGKLSILPEEHFLNVDEKM
jgi:hypothetical protein